MQEVVISRYHVNDSLLNAPASIGKLSASEIQRNNNSDISPILNTVPGVYMQSGGINTNRISIRGIGARTPYGTNKIRAFYGTIPLTSGDGETTIEDIDLEILEGMEIIKGPLSSIYGAGLGGAILLTPKTQNTGAKASISTTIGSYNLVKNTITASYGSKKADINISYHKLQTDGWRQNSAYNREGITLTGRLFKTKNSSLNYFGNYTYLKAYIPSSIDKETFDNNPQAAAPTWFASQGYEKYDSYMGGLAYDWRLSSWLNNSTSVFVTTKENYEPRPFDILTQNTIAFGGRTQFNGDFSIGKIKTQFITGIEYFNDGFEGSTYTNLYEDNNGNGSLQGEQLTGFNQDRDFINAFAQMRFLLSKKFEIQAGVNYNKTHFSLENTYPTEGPSEDYSYDGIWSPQLSALFKPSSLQTIYVSASRGFSMPAIEETLTPQGTINPDIKPENGYNFEAGGKFYLLNKTLYTEISIYHMQINDLLVAQRIGDDQYVGINAGKTLHQGIEALIKYKWQISNALTLQPYAAASIGNYEFREFVDGDNDYTGNDLTGVPSNKINAGFTFETNFGLYLSADYYYTDKIPLNDANSSYSDSYNLLNLKTGYVLTLWPGLTSHFSAGINNVSNTHYASMVLVNATGFGGASPRYYYPGLPINYYGNISLIYSF